MPRNKIKQREIVEYEFSNGIVLGYSNREFEIPEGYAPFINNYMFQHDGTLTPRPSFHVWDAFDVHTGADVSDWNTPIDRTFYMSYSEDAGDYRLGRYSYANDSGFATSSAGFLFTPTGSQIVEIGTTPIPVRTIFGLGSSFGSTVVAPFCIPVGGGFGLPEAGPPPTDVPRTVRVPLQAIAIRQAGSGSGQRIALNLYDINGHSVQPESLTTLEDDTDGVFIRLVSLSVKSRIFLIAGTRISYSAAAQPEKFLAADGGGFIDLDTGSQVVGAFVLQDVIYIATRQELFTLSFSEDPARDGQLRSIAKLVAFGAAEYDNVGYIAVREGLYRVLQGQLTPTLIPNTDPEMSYHTYGIDNPNPLTTDSPEVERIEIPRHCSISKIGSNIILGGLGTSTLSDTVGSPFYTFVYNIDVDAWVTWKGAATGGTSTGFINSFFNMMTPLVELPTRHSQGIQRFWSSVTSGKTYDTSVRFRGIIVTSNFDTEISNSTNLRPFPRLYDTKGNESNNMQITSAVRCEIATPWLDLGAPLNRKRLHRMWITGKFFNLTRNGDSESQLINTWFYNGPNDVLNVTHYDESLSYERPEVSPYDITPNQISLVGGARFEYLSVFLADTILTDQLEWAEGQDFMNRAFYRLYIDATVYTETNKGF